MSSAMDFFYFDKNEEQYYEKVFEEFEKKKIDLDVSIALLKKWVESQRHLPEVPDTNALIYFLTVSKFSVEKAKVRIDMYYTIRGLMPEIFTVHPLSPEMKFQTEITYCFPLPKLTEKNERIIYMGFNRSHGPDEFSHERFFIQLTHMMELLTHKDKNNNMHVIFDCDGVKIGHIPKFSPLVIKKFVVYFQKVYSYRIASAHIVNSNPFAETMMNNVILPLLPSKVQQRVVIDQGTTNILLEFGQSILPTDIGGKESSRDKINEMLMKCFEEMKLRFDTIQHMTTDESLRASELKNDEILGYYGTFKQIDVD
ncbi:retinol-binding protein pinta-like [Euwallacea fornicatus]|uniref:retinol-binding protein pinta-like n=1 Tax=Euwallacea fornicatus TaxID=995702 RepID=UPI00338F6023